MPPDIIEKARIRHQQLSAIIAEADKVRQEHTRLESFMRMLDQLTEDLSPATPPIGTDALPLPDGAILHADQNGSAKPMLLRTDSNVAPPVTNLSIPERAARILQQCGPIHLSELFTEMRRQGWTATGDDIKDRKNLAASLWTRRNQRFRNKGNNVWELMPDKKKGEEMKSAG
jgi:hypothetical protein